jgi:CheY-like chemotaxis protein
MPFNLLIVDDSKTTCTMLRQILAQCDLTWGKIFEASNGIEGLNVLSLSWVDLVLVDLNMPFMDGAQMVAEMSKDPRMKAIPVIVVSAEGDPFLLEALVLDGVKHFVRKPFEPGLVKRLAEEALGVVAQTEESAK